MWHVTAFTKFRSAVLDIIKVADDIAIGLMGKRERNYDWEKQYRLC